MVVPDPPALQHSDRVDRHARRVVDAVGPDRKLRATLRVRAVFKLHLSCDHRLGVVPIATTTAERAETVSGDWVSVGAWRIRARDDGPCREHAVRAAYSVA